METLLTVKELTGFTRLSVGTIQHWVAQKTTRDFIETSIRLTHEGSDKNSNQNGNDGAQPLLSFSPEFEGL